MWSPPTARATHLEVPIQVQLFPHRCMCSTPSPGRAVETVNRRSFVRSSVSLTRAASPLSSSWRAPLRALIPQTCSPPMRVACETASGPVVIVRPGQWTFARARSRGDRVVSRPSSRLEPHHTSLVFARSRVDLAFSTFLTSLTRARAKARTTVWTNARRRRRRRRRRRSSIPISLS